MIADYGSIAELDPIELYNKTNLRRDDFADLMGVQKQTVDCWFCGVRNPSKSARRLAAELNRRWITEGNYIKQGS